MFELSEIYSVLETHYIFVTLLGRKGSVKSVSLISNEIKEAGQLDNHKLC